MITLHDLFEQLGLPSSDIDIDNFVETHQLDPATSLESAPFWNASQIQLITEARAVDADWVLMIDELDALLHQQLTRH